MAQYVQSDVQVPRERRPQPVLPSTSQRQPEAIGDVDGANFGDLSLPLDHSKNSTGRELALQREVERLNKVINEAKFGTHRAPVKGGSENSVALSLAPDAEDIDQVMVSASESEASVLSTGSKASADHGMPKVKSGHHHPQGTGHRHTLSFGPTTNISTVMGSVLVMSRARQALIYTLALGGVVFVLVARSTHLGDPDYGKDAAGNASMVDQDAKRMLGGAAVGAGGVEVSVETLLIHIACCLASAGLLAFFANMLKLPLILGYLLGGVLVGPIGLDIVHSQAEIAELSSLGLVFLLFMIGLELDISELAKMGKVVIFTGMFQFPVCGMIMTSIFMGLDAAGLSFGAGQYSYMYVGVTCSISSTMIVVKLLSEHAEMDTQPGRLTIGILIFQDIWAIVVLAIQPDLANIQIVGLIKTFGMIALLIVVALSYAKWVMPAVLAFSSRSIELMLILALAWCFFMCCLATLPFIGLSMELAALISGVALATFPYSAEFNGKIKYIRDFFITLFFVGLGMQIPVPAFSDIAKAVVVSLVVLVIRWIGIFSIVMVLGGGHRLAAVSTINLSQISEFALVICSLGTAAGTDHIGGDTLTIIIWTFSLLAILSSYLIEYNYRIYGILHRAALRARGKHLKTLDLDGNNHDDGDHVDRNIVILGFHKVAAMLIVHFEHHEKHLLNKLHVIDFHEHIMPELRKRGVTCAYGDISSPDVLEHAHHGEVRLVICSIPDSMLRGVDNLRLLKVCKQVWPQADVIVTADNPRQAAILYEAGADYVVRMAKLCAERLHTLISDHSNHMVHYQHAGAEVHLNHIFAHFKDSDLKHEKDANHINIRAA